MTDAPAPPGPRGRSGRSGRPAAAAWVLAAGLLAGTAACSGGSGGSPTPVGAASGRAGDPAATASPLGPSPTPTPTPPPPSGAVAADASSSAARASREALQLPGCLLGSWTAPVAREFDDLDVTGRSNQAVRAATGDLDLALAADRTWTFTYRKVTLQLSAGSVDVSGPVRGTWSLDGDRLDTRVTGSGLTATMRLGGISASAPAQLTDVLRGLPPNQVRVTCTGGGLQLQLPASQGGGTVTFDRA